MTVAERLARMLARQGLSIRSVAELAGMESQQAWRIVTGKVANPGIETVRRLVEAAGSSMREFFSEDD